MRAREGDGLNVVRVLCVFSTYRIKFGMFKGSLFCATNWFEIWGESKKTKTKLEQILALEHTCLEAMTSSKNKTNRSIHVL